MNQINQTLVTEVVLTGLQNLHIFKVPLFVLFLWIYIVTVYGNVFIIILVSASKTLQSPMYLFIQQLSISDILQTTNIVPVMLQAIIHKVVTLPLSGCISQFYFFGASETLNCLLLTVMSFDRYVAICYPLHYTAIMDRKLCVTLLLMPWLFGFTIILITVNAICTLWFCKQNPIHHFFCDLAPLLELSCSDTTLVQMKVILLSVPVIVFPFFLIIVSYVCIGVSILKIISSIGRQKAFSTCSSHLCVVSIFYGTLIGIYVVPKKGKSQTISKVFSLFYTVVTPLLNPIIYSLRNKDMKEAFTSRYQYLRLMLTIKIEIN